MERKDWSWVYESCVRHDHGLGHQFVLAMLERVETCNFWEVTPDIYDFSDEDEDDDDDNSFVLV